MAAARVGGEAQAGVEVGELFFGASGLADVKGFAVSLLEGGGDPVLAREFLPQACPAFVNPVLFEFSADHLNCLIGEDGDEEVPVATVLAVMIDRAHGVLVRS